VGLGVIARWPEHRGVTRIRLLCGLKNIIRGGGWSADCKSVLFGAMDNKKVQPVLLVYTRTTYRISQHAGENVSLRHRHTYRVSSAAEHITLPGWPHGFHSSLDDFMRTVYSYTDAQPISSKNYPVSYPRRTPGLATAASLSSPSTHKS
jgi:hypothetical protein